MAHLKDLLVTGVAKFLGTIQAKIFKGDLDGNAKTATTAENLSDTGWTSTLGSKYYDDANDCPWGISSIDVNSKNNPFSFWATVLTIGGNEEYKQQIAFPWGTADSLQMPKYRVKDNGVWNSWVDVSSLAGSGGTETCLFDVINVDDGTDINTLVGRTGAVTIYRCIGATGFSHAPLHHQTTNQGILIVYNFNGSGTIGTDSMWIKQIFISPHNGHTMTRHIDGVTSSDWAPEDRKFVIIPDEVIDDCNYYNSYEGIINNGSRLGLPAIWYYVKY